MDNKRGAEVLTEGVEFNLEMAAAEARTQIQNAEMEASREEAEAQELQSELFEAELTAERKEEAERDGKETKEKINETIGG